MVVCKYFLQGTCRFGGNCKYDHTLNDNPTSSESPSILRQRNASGAITTIDVVTLVKSVQTDMINSEKGGQWLLSSYAPFKEKPTFPGFVDQSFEEIRFCFYDATAGGTIEQFKIQYQSAQQEVVSKVRALQNPNDAAVKTIQQIYNTPLGGQLMNSQSVFGSAPFRPTATPSAFGQSQAFTGIPPQTSQYANQLSVFAPAATPFCGAAAPVDSFTAPQQPFQASSGIFGAQIPSTATGSIFTQHTPQTSFSGGSIFTAPTNLTFQQPQPNQQSIFGGQTVLPFGQQAATPFAQSTPNGSFGQQQNQQKGVFNQVSQSSASIFAPTTGNNSVFAPPQQTQTGNIFASALQNSQQKTGNFQAVAQKSGGFPAGPQNTGIFSTAPSSTGIFSSLVQNTGILSTASQTSSGFSTVSTQANLFQHPNQQPGAFQATTAFPPQQAGSSPFGGMALSNNIFVVENAIGQQQQSLTKTANAAVNEEYYSTSEILLAYEAEAYKCDAFDIAMVPTQPPSEEMCV